jgi:acetolactate synthase-1/3 small subunit
VFTRRQINIESLNVSASSIKGVHRYTITAWSDEDTIIKVTKQIEKKIDVLQAHYYVDDEIFMQEVALFKVATPTLLENPLISKTIRRYGARIMEANAVYAVVEKSGVTDEIHTLHNELEAFGCVLQYVSSGRIAVTRDTAEHVNEYLEKINRG